MVCENCQSRPAVVYLTQRIDGQTTSLHLCNHCAAAMETGADGGFMTLENMLESLFGPRPRSTRENLLSKLSEPAQQALQSAAQLSLEWGHERIQSEFILLALIREDPEIRQAIEDGGVDANGYETRLHQVLGRGRAREAAGMGLSSGAKKVLQIARKQAQALGHDFIAPVHLLFGIVLEAESFASQYLSKLDQEHLRQRLAPGPTPPPPSTKKVPKPVAKNLAKFTRNLTDSARAGELDPIVGRESEIERVIRILSRKTKNNPVLIGEPGVGKTAIAEGLAQRIVSDDVPDVLADKQVLALDLAGIVAGTRYRGDFEERFKSLIDEIRSLKGKVILFIDEIHTVVGAGAGEGAMDASNMLKPALARGELQCLGATTLDEYRKYIEKDAALERRFQPVMVAEPTPEQSMEILRGLRDSYEAHHRVKITDEAILAAVELSERYVTERFLPDKAIDLLDEASAMARLGSRMAPERLKQMEERLGTFEKDKNAAVASERYEEAGRLKRDLETMRTELDALRGQWQQRRGTEEPVVTPDAIAAVVSEWTGIPASRLRAEESERLLEMENALRRRVIGQDEAIRAVSEAVRRARAGLKDPNRPIGSFMFLGPTGVGKTETARALAEYLFNDDAAMIRLDMSEYMERHTVSRLIGAPPGYVGYEESGRLTEAVRRRPYSVILFDEIEKAHPEVFNVLLQILDDGRLTDAHGRTISFKNAIIIMTSNAGAEALSTRRAALGFQTVEGAAANDETRVQTLVLDAMRARFSPEFINRIDEVIVFHPLDRPQLAKIVDLLLETTRRKMRAQRIGLALTERAREALAERGFDPRYGARPLRRVIQREIETVVSRMMLRGEAREGETITVDFKDGQLSFRGEPPRAERVA